MRIEKIKDYAPGGTVVQAWEAFEAHWRKQIGTCAWVKVSHIQALTQRGKGWTVKYRVKEASVTQPINPSLALELLDNNLVGHALVNAWFIVNPTRAEEMVMVE
jgi:hypothetical protein